MSSPRSDAGNSGKAVPENPAGKNANVKEVHTLTYTADKLPNHTFIGNVPEKYSTDYFNKMDKKKKPQDNLFVSVSEQDIGSLKTVMVKNVPTPKCDVLMWPARVEKDRGDTTVDEPQAIIVTFWGDEAARMQETMRRFIGKVN
jgi:hypothetical protein